MPRDNGWLKPDALKTAGVSEQFAVERDGVRHEVSLSHDRRQGGYVTQRVSISPDMREVHAWQVGEKLDLARSIFRREVRTLGGRA